VIHLDLTCLAERVPPRLSSSAASALADDVDFFCTSACVQTLNWSLKHGGFSLTKPFHEETQLPPIHYCVAAKKTKSLKCMLECLDRLRDFSVFIVRRWPSCHFIKHSFA
jgi:hypothetical protein